jgi:hypothetical protein
MCQVFVVAKMLGLMSVPPSTATQTGTNGVTADHIKLMITGAEQDKDSGKRKENS